MTTADARLLAVALLMGRSSWGVDALQYQKMVERAAADVLALEKALEPPPNPEGPF